MMRGMLRSVLHIEALALSYGSVSITPEEAHMWVMAHRDEPIDTLTVMLMAQGYGADNCDEVHDTPAGDCNCFTQLTDGDLWEIDDRTGKPIIEFAEWWGPFELWRS
jgi:hypothetical protein